MVIGVTASEGGIHIYVQDDGVGFDISSILTQEESSGSYKKIGLRNIDKRLKNLYGNDYGLKIEAVRVRNTHINAYSRSFRGAMCRWPPKRSLDKIMKNQHANALEASAC